VALICRYTALIINKLYKRTTVFAIEFKACSCTLDIDRWTPQISWEREELGASIHSKTIIL
jgi:hypothetical protein